MSDIPGINPTSDAPTTQIGRLKAITELLPCGPFGPEYAIEPPGIEPPHVIMVAQVAAEFARRQQADVIAGLHAEKERLDAEIALLRARIEHAALGAQLSHSEERQS